ncbi:hypothetical protein X777_09189, partial [Ooceraea biroi]
TSFARNILNESFPDRWIGRGGRISWPARSPDLTPLDFFARHGRSGVDEAGGKGRGGWFPCLASRNRYAGGNPAPPTPPTPYVIAPQRPNPPPVRSAISLPRRPASLLSSSGTYNYAHTVTICLDGGPYHYMTFDRQSLPRVFAVVCQCCIDALQDAVRGRVVVVVVIVITTSRHHQDDDERAIMTTCTKCYDDFTRTCKSSPGSSYVGSAASEKDLAVRKREGKMKKKMRKDSPTRLGLRAGIDIIWSNREKLKTLPVDFR